MTESDQSASSSSDDSGNGGPTPIRLGAITAVGVVTFILGMTILLAYALTLSLGSTFQAIALVNTFGFLTGSAIILLSFYAQFAPRTDLPFTPARQIPIHVTVTLFFLGSAVILTSLQSFGFSAASLLFWRVVGYSVLLAVASGLVSAFIEMEPPEESRRSHLARDD